LNSSVVLKMGFRSFQEETKTVSIKTIPTKNTNIALGTMKINRFLGEYL
jgi:hypothetical protein